MAAEPIKRLFTTGEYHTMLEAGILKEDDRVELIEGEIWKMAPIGSAHAACVKRSNGLFNLGLQGHALVGIQDPVQLDDLSEPQPDLSLLRPRDDFYERSHPTPADILLLIEVVDSSAAADRKHKIPLYGRNGVLESWLIDLTRSAIEVYRDPSPEGYRSVRRLRPGDTVSPLAFPNLVLEVSAFLG